jgi:hypothetical protein
VQEYNVVFSETAENDLDEVENVVDIRAIVYSGREYTALL